MGRLTTSSSPTPGSSWRWRSAASATRPLARIASAKAASPAGSRAVEKSTSKAIAAAPAAISAFAASA